RPLLRLERSLRVTRSSEDLREIPECRAYGDGKRGSGAPIGFGLQRVQEYARFVRERFRRSRAGPALREEQQRARSEEHTSELQSREKLVCRLLLEKKNISAILPALVDGAPSVGDTR